MKLNSIKVIIKERWKIYLGGYLLGYVFQLIMDGVNSWQSLFPIKLLGIICVFISNALYYGTKKLPVVKYIQEGIKSIVVLLVLFIIIGLVKQLILVIFGFNIAPLIGIR